MATINTALNDALIAQNALEAFTKKLAPLSAISTSYSNEATRRGASISVPVVASISASNFSSSTGYEVGGGTLDAVTVNLSNHKIASVALTDQDVAKSSTVDINKWSYQIGKSLAQTLLTDVFSNITAANFGTTNKVTKATASVGLADLRAMRTLAVKNDLDISECSVFLAADVYDKLLGESNVIANLALQGNALGTGAVPTLFGMPIYELNFIPSNSEGLTGFLIHPSALAVAVRVLEPQDTSMYLATSQVTDDVSGVSMGYRRHYNPGKGTHFLNGEIVYGVATGLSSSVVRLVSA
jgi:hypothetical protein